VATVWGGRIASAKVTEAGRRDEQGKGHESHGGRENAKKGSSPAPAHPASANSRIVFFSGES
jgi:hypothetical protein